MRCYERWQLVGVSFIKDSRSARLIDLLLLTPFLISSGLLYDSLPMNVRIAFIVAGIIVGLWNGLGILLEDHIPTYQDIEFGGPEEHIGSTYKRQGNHIIVGEPRPLKPDANLNPGDYIK